MLLPLAVSTRPQHWEPVFTRALTGAQQLDPVDKCAMQAGRTLFGAGCTSFVAYVVKACPGHLPPVGKSCCVEW
jgi:hypothetical protein